MSSIDELNAKAIQDSFAFQNEKQHEVESKVEELGNALGTLQLQLQQLHADVAGLRGMVLGGGPTS